MRWRGDSAGTSLYTVPGSNIAPVKYVFYFGHPAHFHLFRHVIERLRQKSHAVLVVAKTKDILEDLLQRAEWQYVNVQHSLRGDGKLRIAFSLLSRDWKLLTISRRFRPDLMLGTSAEITHVGSLLRIPSMVVNEDDVDVVPDFARLAYTTATHIVAPDMCGVGRWTNKTIGYPGFQELAYLHPNHFTPNPSIRHELGVGDGPYFIVRLAKLNAYHDSGRTGIGTDVAALLLNRLTRHGRVFITAERALERRFEPYRIRIDPLRIHHALAFAQMYIGDSQTMAAEAAVLGTPSIRFNDFVGQIGYLEVLEKRYGLTYGIPTSEPHRLMDKVAELLAPAVKREWAVRRDRMLDKSVDAAAFMTWLADRYPHSVEEFRQNPDIVSQFIKRTRVPEHCG